MSTDPYSRFLQKHLGRRRVLALTGSAGAAALLTACSAKTPSEPSTESPKAGGSATPTRPDGWSDESHGNEAEPNFGLVFPSDKVNEVAITISAENWQRMLDDMTNLFGARGMGGGQPGRPGGNPGGVIPQQGGLPPGGAPAGGGAGPGGGGDFTAENPIWVPATVAFNGKTWTNVGVRFKGNSSLTSAWRGGTDKMPLKLDFDEFEKDHPEIENQRFYGFKQLSLSNNFSDPAFMRETTAYDIFEAAGLVAANTAPWLVTLDRGEGPKALGIYTAIEVIDDTVITRSFEDDSGNIYEGDGRGASLAAGVEAQIESSFQVEGGDNADWSDIRALYAALHANNRTTDPAAWRKQIESLFEVDSFLEWLGIAATLQHWDTYGGMTHNFYLYNNPGDGRLHWISWDHNEVLGNRAGGGGNAPAGGGPGGRANVSFDKADVGSNWPLIRFLLDQPEYKARYNGYLKEFATKFDPAKLSAKYDAMAAVLRPHIGTDTTESAFNSAVDALKQATKARSEALKAYVATL